MNLIAIPEEQFSLLKEELAEIKKLLNQKKPAVDDLITEEVLFEKLGNPDKSTIWRYEKKGFLNPIRIGSKKMYRLSDLFALQSIKKA